MKRICLIVLLFLCFSIGKAQTADELLYLAKTTCLSSDFKKSDSLYSKLDSIDSITYFFDLYYYYVAAEVVKDTAKIENLLYRLAQSNGFEKDFMQYYFNYFKTYERPYWHKVDSLINITESYRCQHFIDSLAVMAERDQAVRNMEWNEETMRLADVVDSTNMAKLLKLIEQYGFPTWKLVGQEGSANAWIIAQHSTEYIDWYLKRFRKAVEENNASRQELAYMEDRLLVYNGRPQLYGTQFLYSVADSIAYLYATIDMKHLDERRVLMDMYFMEEYLKRAEIGNVDLHRGYGNYLTTYYPNLNNFYTLMNYCENQTESPDTALFNREK